MHTCTCRELSGICILWVNIWGFFLSCSIFRPKKTEKRIITSRYLQQKSENKALKQPTAPTRDHSTQKRISILPSTRTEGTPMRWLTNQGLQSKYSQKWRISSPLLFNLMVICPSDMIIYTYKLTNCTNKLRNASTRVNNYIFITTLDKRWS